MRSLVGTVAALSLALTMTSTAFAWDAESEQRNFSRTQHRFAYDQTDPAWQIETNSDGVMGIVDILERDLHEEGERFSGSLCGSGTLTCAGDPRTEPEKWDGIVEPVTYLNRNGAHIEGHVWRSKDAAGALPGVVIETGSVQAPERWYYWAAQVLANHGYLVMTFDVQGQGRSDFGGSHDRHFFDGQPAQDIDHFVEDLEDAIDFFFSSPATPYDPGTDHARARQQKRAGAVDVFNPLADRLDPGRFGIVGHSLGAQSVSIVQGTDPRVDAVVAWDNLSTSGTPRVPALGMAGDYGLAVHPHATDPERDAKLAAFKKWRAAGLPAMEVVLRGGTHFEWSYSPGPVLPASLRGIDAAAWYTTAWLDRWVKGELDAERRILTDRWHADEIDAFVDREGAGNMHSFYFRSPVDLADGRSCPDLRTGCGLLVNDDGVSRETPYSYLGDR